jgi:archaemetzincin
MTVANVETLQLVPIYCGQHPSALDRLALRLEHLFRVRVERHNPTFDPEIAYERTRSQYNSRLFLAQLLRDSASDSGRVLGLTGLDLFIPVLTFVFGEAQLDGRVAVISTHRLDNQLYGLPPAPDLLFDRICKEAIHELGHTYNLVHCHDGLCVMSSSTTVDAIDMKSEHFCDDCRRSLNAHPARRGL